MAGWIKMALGTELDLEISTNPMRKLEIAVVHVYVVAINARYILDPTDKKIPGYAMPSKSMYTGPI